MRIRTLVAAAILTLSSPVAFAQKVNYDYDKDADFASFDAERKTIVWRGVATKEIDPDASPEKRERNLDRTAEQLFKNYPPAR
jgi:hypothetical protein